jgi:hypothetical protein
MHFAVRFHEVELIAQQTLEAISVVLHDRQSAAFRWAAWRKAGDDRPAVAVEGGVKRANIEGLVIGFGEEVQHGAVVPESEALGRTPGRHVRRNPCDALRFCAKSCARLFECRRGDIEHCHISEAVAQQVIDQGRCAAADVDESAMPVRRINFSESTGSD